MRSPNLRVLPTPSHEAMAELGGMTIAGVLGAYTDNLDERHNLTIEVLELAGDGPVQQLLETKLALYRVQTRLFLYATLLHQLADSGIKPDGGTEGT